MYRVLGELATAANRLPQLCSQLARWLDRGEHRRAARRRPRPVPAAVAYVMARLDQNAPRYAALLGGALDDAQQATAGLYRPGGGGEDQ